MANLFTFCNTVKPVFRISVFLQSENSPALSVSLGDGAPSCQL